MPYITGSKGRGEYYSKISKKKEEELKKKGYKPFDVRVSLTFPRGGKYKVWAKNKEDANATGSGIVDYQTMDPETSAGSHSVRIWKKPNQPKTRKKRKNSKDYRPVKVTRVHPKTGKKFTQTIYKRIRSWER